MEVNTRSAERPGRIRRYAAEGFGSLIDLLDVAVPEPDQSGAALSVWMDGRPIVDAQYGLASSVANAPWVDDSVSVTYSCTKGVASVLVAMLVERGLVSFDDPLAGIWPEFGAHGKNAVTIGDALAHRAGVPVLRHELELSQMMDGHSLADAVAAQRPFWQPGTSHQYHSLIHGVFTEQLVSRITGMSLPDFFAAEVSEALDADYWFGLPDHEAARMVTVRPDPTKNQGDTNTAESAARPLPELVQLERRETMYGGITLQTFADNQHLRRSSFAGYGGIGTADALARIWSACVASTNGVRLLSDRTGRLLRAPRSTGRPFVDASPPYQHWGAGVMIPSPFQRYLSSESFGHDGAGGQIAFADPPSRIGFAFLTNQMGSAARGNAIVRELRALLDS